MVLKSLININSSANEKQNAIQTKQTIDTHMLCESKTKNDTIFHMPFPRFRKKLFETIIIISGESFKAVFILCDYYYCCLE